MQEGKVAALGPVGEIAARADLPFASGGNAGAIITAVVKHHDEARALTQVDSNGALILVPLIEQQIGSNVRLRIPAGDVVLATEAPRNISANNVVHGITRTIHETPDHKMALVEISVGETLLLSQLTPDAVDQIKIEPGSPVFALFKSIAVQVL
jgi:molybdate transport system ATP-binding protein